MVNHGKSQFLIMIEYYQKPKKPQPGEASSRHVRCPLVRQAARKCGNARGDWLMNAGAFSNFPSHSNSQDFENNKFRICLNVCFCYFLMSKWWQWLKQPGNLGGLSWHVRTRWKWLDELMKISKAGFGSRFWKTLPRHERQQMVKQTRIDKHQLFRWIN